MRERMSESFHRRTQRFLGPLDSIAEPMSTIDRENRLPGLVGPALRARSWIGSHAARARAAWVHREWEAKINWLSATDPANPFGVVVLDCQSAVARFQAVTAATVPLEAVDAIIEMTGRTSGQDAPFDAIDVSLDYRCDSARCQPTAAMVMSPESPNHRWALRVENGTINAYRARTGELVHQAVADVGDGSLTVKSLRSSKPAVFDSQRFAAAEFKFLLQRMLAGAPAIFPIAPNLARDDKVQIAVAAWNSYGPLAEFGSTNY